MTVATFPPTESPATAIRVVLRPCSAPFTEIDLATAKISSIAVGQFASERRLSGEDHRGPGARGDLSYAPVVPLPAVEDRAEPGHVEDHGQNAGDVLGPVRAPGRMTARARTSEYGQTLSKGT
jgi:hypothetical protein